MTTVLIGAGIYAGIGLLSTVFIYLFDDMSFGEWMRISLVWPLAAYFGMAYELDFLPWSEDAEDTLWQFIADEERLRR